MKRSEFLTELREDLAFELPERLVKENVDYYNNYISEEVRAGKSEQQVLEDLGDPRLIARSVIDAAKSGADGIPGSTDDVNFREEIYGSGKQEAPEVDQKGRATSAGKKAAGGGPSAGKENGGRFSVNGREIGCGGCLVICLIAVGVWSLLMSLLSNMDPSVTLLIVAVLGLVLLFRKSRK